MSIERVRDTPASNPNDPVQVEWVYNPDQHGDGYRRHRFVPRLLHNEDWWKGKEMTTTPTPAPRVYTFTRHPTEAGHDCTSLGDHAGEYVLLADYQTLAARLARVTALADEWNARAENWRKRFKSETIIAEAQALDDLVDELRAVLAVPVDARRSANATPEAGRVTAIVDAAKVVVAECRDDYSIIGSYQVEPVLFDDLIKAVDALAAPMDDLVPDDKGQNRGGSEMTK